MIKGTNIQDIKSWLERIKTTYSRLAFIAQYYSRRLFFQIKKRAPGLKKIHLDSFPAIHIKRMDWMDFVLKFSSEIMVLLLGLLVAGMNLMFFSSNSGKNFQDQSLASTFLSHHTHLNQKLAAKNSSIVTVVSKNGFVPQAMAEDFSGLDSQGLSNQTTSTDHQDIVLGDESTILAPNPDSVQSLIAKQVKIYQTQKGDTLKNIAQNFGISQQTIMSANKLTAPEIKPGWQLIILPTDGVLVKATANDTLPDIAHAYNPEKYNTNATIRENSADALLQKIISYNALDGAEDINPGDVIIVPGGQIVLPPAPKVTPTKPKNNTTVNPNAGIDQVTSLGDGYDGVNHIFPKGYCTYYVASRMKITFGGNAKNWLANAKASGYVVSQEAAPRTAVVMTGNASRSMRLYGHVAYVEKVEDGKILISEMNYVGFNKTSQRWLSIHDASIRGYIYQ
ncbi:MAG: LysM peptidoglycan-binding domain-containing protein [Candidatus Doudnabacteria bacterium]|nr:LysM peptidoglycan-binding domain-containing protein [Candidatus Doudnabacteria bacterium]